MVTHVDMYRCNQCVVAAVSRANDIHLYKYASGHKRLTQVRGHLMKILVHDFSSTYVAMQLNGLLRLHIIDQIMCTRVRIPPCVYEYLWED